MKIGPLNSTRHLAIRFSNKRYGVDTIDEHKKIISNRGEVWWGVFSKRETVMAENRYRHFQKQLEDNIPTYAILISGDSYYQAKMKEIQRYEDEGYPEEEKDLIPDYYRDSESDEIWLKFSSIEEKDESVLDEYKVLSSGNPLKDSIKGQSTLMDIIKGSQNNENNDPSLLSNKNCITGLLENKKQVILYGPPGTGKTYKSKDFAVGLLIDKK